MVGNSMRSGTNVRAERALYGEREGLCNHQLTMFCFVLRGVRAEVSLENVNTSCFYKPCANQALEMRI